MDEQLKKLLQRLKDSVKSLKDHNEDMDEASWGYEIGVLLTGNDALLIIAAIEKKRNLELKA